MKRFYPEMEKEILVCVTEKHSREDIDRLAEILEGIRDESGEFRSPETNPRAPYFQAFKALKAFSFRGAKDERRVAGRLRAGSERTLDLRAGGRGRKGYSLPRLDVEKAEAEKIWPRKWIRKDLEGFPEMSEVEVVRHFTRLSQWNYGVDSGFYPLGSCTMKYNPKVNEDLARLPGFAGAHPYLPEEISQGALQLMYDLERFLCEISGMDRVTLQPSAGAQGELTGMLMIRAYLTDRGNPRHKVLVPDTAHGTNPASSGLCGYQVVQVKSNERGVLSPQAVEEKMDEDVAALMVTNPNTLGSFRRKYLPDRRDRPPERGTGLLRRSQPECPYGADPAGRYGGGRSPFQPP